MSFIKVMAIICTNTLAGFGCSSQNFSFHFDVVTAFLSCHYSFEWKKSVNENHLVPDVAPSTIVPNQRSKKWSKWQKNTTFTLKTFKIMYLSCLVKKNLAWKKIEHWYLSFFISVITTRKTENVVVITSWWHENITGFKLFSYILVVYFITLQFDKSFLS